MPQRLFCILPTGECKPNFHCFLETILNMKNALLATGTAAEANSEAQEAPVLFVVRICGCCASPIDSNFSGRLLCSGAGAAAEAC